MTGHPDSQQGMPGLDPSTIVRAAKLVATADGLVIAAGAGMGVDSGLPDFRGNAGFWRLYPLLAASGLGFMVIASPVAFHADPRRAWGFYGHRLALCRRAIPHDGYAMLRTWSDAMEHGSFVYTSNVDGHFHKAGFDPARVDECHGTIHALQCLEPCCMMAWPATAFVPVVDEPRCELMGPLPACPSCGGIARPQILMFHDSGWVSDRHERQRARLQAWLERLRRPVVLEIGAGINVATVRRFSQRVVLGHQGSLIRINPGEHDIGNLQGIGIGAPALQALRAIDAVLGGWRDNPARQR